MKNSVVAALILILGFFSFLPPNGEGAEGRPAYRKGEVLVQFHEGTPPGITSALHGSIQGKVRRNLPERVQLITLPTHIPVDRAIGIYRANPRVKHAEPNYLVRRAAPNDQHFSQQWYLYNSGQPYSGLLSGTIDADIGALEAWALHTGTDQVIVAVLDTGIDYLHPDLAANIWTNPGEAADGRDADGNGRVDDVRGWNFVTGDNDPMDDNTGSHGTHAAGIIGAVGNNTIGVSGVNWTVRLMPLKVLDDNGFGNIADVVAAIDYAIEMGARVINASLGSHSLSLVERQAIRRAEAAGVLFVAAAGNSENGNDNDVKPFYPAAHPVSNIIAVAATDANDNLAPFSHYGAASVHLAAPGAGILSTLHRDRGRYGFADGTSMAAPMVSGAAALLMSYNPELSMEEVRRLLLATSFSYPAIDGTVVFGRLDAGEALRAAYLPFAPTNLRVVNSASDLLLGWEYFGTEEFIDLERREGFGEFKPLITLPAGTSGYRDSTFSNTEGLVISYRARVRTGTESSDWSVETSFGIPPLAPENLQADIDQGGVLLSWEDHSQVEKGYEIERWTEGGDFQRIASLPENSIEHFDDEVEDGKIYSYRVRALNNLNGPSPYSEEVRVTFSASASIHDFGSSPASGGRGGGGGCFIATAAFGSELHPRVAGLRQFRDEALLPHRWGRVLNDLYLLLSPPVARQVERSEVLRMVVRSALVPVFWAVEWWLGAGEENEDVNRSESARSAAPIL